MQSAEALVALHAVQHLGARFPPHGEFTMPAFRPRFSDGPEVAEEAAEHGAKVVR
jgi:hypothetical protein